MSETKFLISLKCSINLFHLIDSYPKLLGVQAQTPRVITDFSFFPLQWLLNHHETDTYNSLGCCGNGFLATSWCQKACVCPRAVSEVDHLPIILISTGHTSLGDFRG